MAAALASVVRAESVAAPEPVVRAAPAVAEVQEVQEAQAAACARLRSS